jgi:hypothetical protein
MRLVLLALALGSAGCHWLIGHSPAAADRTADQLGSSGTVSGTGAVSFCCPAGL